MSTGRERNRAYSPPRPGGNIDLFLDANEGASDGGRLAEALRSIDPERLRRYPSATELEAALAARHGVSPARVIVTAGADEAIDRVCRAFLAPEQRIILPLPTFEMIGRYAALAGAGVDGLPWPCGPFPTHEVLARVDDRVRMIAVVSPNNPTGAVATRAELEAVARGAPGVMILADLAYAEFADEDLTGAVVSLPNVIAVRTFSKAWGLAGLRIGYAIGAECAIERLRAVGSPYPVSGVSLALARHVLEVGEATMRRGVERVREERGRLVDVLRTIGARPRASQANFVLAEFDEAGLVWSRLAASGIAVRRFEPGRGLDRALRITCPCNEPAFERLCGVLEDCMGRTGTGRKGACP